jgi:hypothetical protein
VGTTLTNGLVVYYPLHGDVSDYSGNGNDAINYGTSFAADKFGNASSALVVSSNNYIASKNNIGIIGNSSRTISLWVLLKNNPIFPSGQLICWGDNAASSAMRLEYNGSHLTADESYLQSWISNSIALNNWHHIVYTYSESINNTQFYIDGIIQASASIQNLTGSQFINTTDGTVYINSPTPQNLGQFGINGFISDVRIYNRSLSSNEIALLYSYESDPCSVWINGLQFGLTKTPSFYSSLAANTNFVSALASTITSSSNNYGISQVGPPGPQGLQGLQGPAGARGPTGVFDPTVLTNTSFLTGLASNPTFISAVATQLLSGSNNYGIAVKQSQSLSFPAIPTITITPGKKFTNTVTASTALPVTQIVGNTAIATLTNNVLTILSAGSTTITASQAGNALWNPVTTSQPLIVNKGTQTLTFTAIASQTYAVNKKLTLSSTSSAALNTNTTYLIDNGAIGTISNNIILLLGTGTATITATNSGNTYFAPAFATQKLIVK